jgi:hypothetical protein
VTGADDSPECTCGETHDHASCLNDLREAFAGLDFDVHVSTLRPLVRNPFTMPPFVCPHGVEHWVEPTGEQLARWTAERAP